MPVSSRGNSDKAKTPLSLVFGDNGKTGGFVVDAQSLVGHAVCVGGEFENSGWLSSLGKQALSQGYPVTWFGAPGLVSVGDEIHRAALEAGFGDKIQRISFDAAESRTSMKSFSLNKDITLPSDTLSNMLADILMGSWDYPDGHSMWLGRSISMIMPVAHALCWKRDELGIPFDFDDLADSTEFEQYENIARDPTIPAYLANKMNGYLISLPGYDLGSKVPSVHAVQSHGYLSMQYQCLLKKLSGLLKHETGAERIDWGEIGGQDRVLIFDVPKRGLDANGPKMERVVSIMAWYCEEDSMRGKLGCAMDDGYGSVPPNEARQPRGKLILASEPCVYSRLGLFFSMARALGTPVISAFSSWNKFKSLCREEMVMANASTLVVSHENLCDPLCEERLDGVRAHALLIGQEMVGEKIRIAMRKKQCLSINRGSLEAFDAACSPNKFSAPCFCRFQALIGKLGFQNHEK